MRVLFLTTHVEVGGIPAYTVTLAEQLARRGHHPVVCSRGGLLVERLTAAGIPHHPVALGVKSELHPLMAVAIGQVLAVIRRARPDVLHAQTRVAHAAAGVVGRLTGIPVVTTAHGFYDWHWGRRAFPFWGRRVIAVSPSVRQLLIERYGVPPAKVALIANGIAWTPWDPARLAEAVARFRQTSGIRGDGPVVGTVTRLAPAKGLPTLLQAFHQLRRQVPSARLLIVGDGPLKTELVRSAYALGEQEQIIFSGIAVETRVPLSMMDVFVLPSHHEAFGLAIVEAMAMGRPVVASRVGGIPTIVDDGVTGLLVPPNDPDALARALGQMLDDPERRRAMGSAGHARYEREFTMDRVAREVESVYEEVVQG
ncbi:MAG: hypothetical protein A3C53_02815 [Omnitrophica WOR_2 bacterium RIFCSPHIGHO2_02_FULL_68_15]|nr:MAG: hypothetical protein A3C53_02815 [Omnitrophica WOR_2 bacterium RIFCSPHIGHO2_02_FULL_68_15]